MDAIYIKLGALSGIVKEALLSAYDLARERNHPRNCAAGHRRSARNDLLPALSGASQRSFHPAVVL